VAGGDEAIRLEHLSFRYPDQHTPAVCDVSLAVRRGEMVVIMGATGAGKTTLAKCLNRTIPAFQPGALSGQVTILGRTLTHEGVAELAGAVGLLSQDFESQLFATNVLQEVVFGMEQLGVAPGDMRRRAERALRAVGLSGFGHRDPAMLSGGEKQRLAIAAALALEPSVLVFDEPTTDLDPLGKLEIFAVLAAMRNEGYTLVVIEHEVAAAEKADRLVVMSHGRIVADDVPHRVLARVDFLCGHGVRPPDLSRVADRLLLVPSPQSLEDAEAALRDRGIATRAVELRPAAEPEEGRSARLLEIGAVEFAYESGARALQGVSLNIAAAEFLALIGQNGSGKTTLAKHLNGLLRPSAGRVLLDGRDMRELPINRVASDVGYVFQNPDHQIFAATVHDEVAFGPRNFGVSPQEVRARVAAALDVVGLSGLEPEDPFLLSKGHRQRLAVASLLALRPRVLILDEPTTGLDYREQHRMMDLLGQLHRQGMAVVIITHSPWVVAEYAQRGVLMAGGRILFDGPLRALFADEELLESAHFCAPDITRLGRRFGFTPLSVAEFFTAVGSRRVGQPTAER
jgi:energy-coupling factor transport system ATP-binding protein